MSSFQDRNSFWDFSAFIFFSVSNSISHLFTFSLYYYYLRMCSLNYRFIFPFLSTFYCYFLLICRTIPYPHFFPSLSFFYNNSRAQFDFSYHPQCVAADVKKYVFVWMSVKLHAWVTTKTKYPPWMVPQRLEGVGFLTRMLLIIKNWVV